MDRIRLCRMRRLADPSNDRFDSAVLAAQHRDRIGCRIGAIDVRILGDTPEHMRTFGIAQGGAIHGAENLALWIEDVDGVTVLVRSPDFVGRRRLLRKRWPHNQAAETQDSYSGQQPSVRVHSNSSLSRVRCNNST